MFTQEKADALCSRLAAGLSLRKACEAEGGPDPSTVLRWKDDSAEFAQQYARAREVGYQLLADEILEISDDSRGDVWIDDQGNERADVERVARSKLRVDSRKWMLSKMLPKVYGEKTDVTLSGDPDRPLVFRWQK